MPTREEVVTNARAYLGVRWQHQGRTRQGVDCAGLVICVAHELGLSDFDTKDYGRLPDTRRIVALLREHMDQVNGPWLPGDVLLMRFEGDPQHLAVVTDVGIIHAMAQRRQVVEHGLDAVWRSRVVSAWAFRGVA